MSPGPVPLPNVPDALTPALLGRFRADLSALFDCDRGTLLVAVSGGGDSLALLLLAHALLGDRCVVATVDHGLRAAAADEAAFVADLCGRRGIPHRVLRDDLPPRVGRTANLSSRARALRYCLIEDARQRAGADAIATAHHADDQIETLVMRLNRGAGVAGLAGVRARSGRVIRPLLGWRRAELAALVSADGIVPVADPSNVDDRFDRARLRKNLAAVTSFDAAGWQTSATALADAEDALAFAADRLFAECGTTDERSAGFTPEGIPFELRRRLALRCLVHVDPAIDPRGGELARLVDALASGRPATLGSVRASVVGGGGGPFSWRFEPAPPRRAR